VARQVNQAQQATAAFYVRCRHAAHKFLCILFVGTQLSMCTHASSDLRYALSHSGIAATAVSAAASAAAKSPRRSWAAERLAASVLRRLLSAGAESSAAENAAAAAV